MKPLTLQLTTPVHLLTLIGGGEFSFGDTRAVDEFILAGRKRVAFLPTASGSAEYAGHFGKYLKQINPDVETVNVPIYRGRDNKRQKNLDLIRSADLIYIGGGVANVLITMLRESPAEAALREAAAGGATIAAIGAAASSFGINGLGWIEGAVVDTGFSPDDDEPLRRLMSLPDARIGIGIPPKTALAIRGDGTTEIVGDGTLAVFRKSPGV